MAKGKKNYFQMQKRMFHICNEKPTKHWLTFVEQSDDLQNDSNTIQPRSHQYDSFMPEAIEHSKQYKIGSTENSLIS